jgi:acetyl/propionyl-CoA carboxylase alpha subunit
MIAKLIAGGATRTEALDRLAAALAETEVVGVTTNLPFLRWLVAHPSLRSGDTTTAFLTEHPPLSPPPAALPEDVWRVAFRLNLPPPLSRPAPDIDAAASEHAGQHSGPSTISAPMPGTVLKVHVHAGSTVKAGMPLVVLEAMKMETPLASPYDATVRAVHVQEGDRVAGGALLVELDD